MDMPVCENVARGQCPKSDVRLYAEHGSPQHKYYTTFGCRTCKLLFIVWEPGMLETAKKQQLDKTIGNLVNPERFKGWGR